MKSPVSPQDYEIPGQSNREQSFAAAPDLGGQLLCMSESGVVALDTDAAANLVRFRWPPVYQPTRNVCDLNFVTVASARRPLLRMFQSESTDVAGSSRPLFWGLASQRYCVKAHRSP